MGKQRLSLASRAALAQPMTAQSALESRSYLDRSAIRVLKEVALPYDKKVHDLLIEGVNMMLAK
jgi:hypothetical protein